MIHLNALQVFPSTYVHLLHRTAIMLGHWTKVEDRRISHTFYSQWSSSTVWPINSIVRHGKDLYKSEGVRNCAEPGNLSQSKFYVSFFFLAQSLKLGVLICLVIL